MGRGNTHGVRAIAGAIAAVLATSMLAPVGAGAAPRPAPATRAAATPAPAPEPVKPAVIEIPARPEPPQDTIKITKVTRPVPPRPAPTASVVSSSVDPAPGPAAAPQAPTPPSIVRRGTHGGSDEIVAASASSAPAVLSSAAVSQSVSSQTIPAPVNGVRMEGNIMHIYGSSANNKIHPFIGKSGNHQSGPAGVGNAVMVFDYWNNGPWAADAPCKSTNAAFEWPLGSGIVPAMGSCPIYDQAGNNLIAGIMVHGNHGNDELFFESGGTAPVTGVPAGITSGYTALLGEEGLDKLSAGVGGSDLIGGPENDELYGSAAADKLYGEDGNDYLLGGGSGDDLWGGPGEDTLDYSGASSAIKITQTDGQPNDGEQGGAEGDNVHDDIEIIRGSGHADHITGGDGPNQLYGNGGNDILNGRGGADLLSGGDGFDTVLYHERTAGLYIELDGVANDPDGDNVMADIEVVVGGKGNDWIHGNAGHQELYGNGGSDELYSHGGADILDGDGAPQSQWANNNPANDWFYAAAGGDHIYGDGGADNKVSYAALGIGIGSPSTSISLSNLAGGDVIHNGAFSTLEGTFQNDYLAASGPGQTLRGITGDDTFYPAQSGGAAIDGDTGEDTVSYELWSVGVDVSVDDAGTSIENLIGTSRDDALTGNSSVNKLDGRGGDDYFAPDTNDKLTGGSGKDTVDLSHTNGVTATIGGSMSGGGTIANDVEVLIGGGGVDTLTGNDSENWIYGDDAGDHIYGRGGNDHLYGEDGFDDLHGENGGDELRGGDGSDVLDGGDGADRMWWEPGGDTYSPGANCCVPGAFDVIDYSLATASISISLNDGVCNEGPLGEGDCIMPADFNNMVAIIGSAYDDRMIGNGERNWLIGFGGSDVFYGEGGADQFSGDCDGAGAFVSCSVVSLGDHDSVHYFTDQPVFARIGGFEDSGRAGEKDTINKDVEDLWGGSGNDVLFGNIQVGGNHDNTLVGLGGDDHLYGLAGADTLDGGDGNDTLYGYNGTQFDGPGEPDTLFGGWGDDKLYGEDGKDYLHGDLGDDLLDGGQRDGAVDQIDARDGTITLYEYVPDPTFRDTIYCGNGLLGADTDQVKWDVDTSTTPPQGDRDINGNCEEFLPAFVQEVLGFSHKQFLKRILNISWYFRFVFAPSQIDLPLLPPSVPGRSRVTMVDLFDLKFDRDLTYLELLKKAAISAGRSEGFKLAYKLGENVVVDIVEGLLVDFPEGPPGASPGAMNRSAVISPVPNAWHVEITNISGALDPAGLCQQGPTRRTVFCPLPQTFNMTTDAGNDNVFATTTVPGLDTNTVRLGADDDSYINPTGSQDVDGGSGVNTMIYDRPPTANVTVQLPGTGTSTGNGEAGENDILRNFQGAIGGDETDTFSGTTGAESFDGGGGLNDTVSYADAGHDTVGVTVTLPEPDQETTVPGEGDKIKNIENVWGGGAADTLTGSSLNNIIRGRRGNDTLDGQGGEDTFDVSEKDSTQAVWVTLPEIGASAASAIFRNVNVENERDSVKNFENVTGGAGGDRITGNAVANVLLGMGGNDFLDGVGGPDVMNGGADNDTINYDVNQFTPYRRTQGVKVSIADGANDGAVNEKDDVQTSPGNDTIVGTAFNDTFVPEMANRHASRTNTFKGQGGTTDLVDYAATTTRVLARLDGTPRSGFDANGDGIADQTDTLHPTIEYILGGRNNDALYGNSSNNLIIGFDGDDLLQGGLGNDVLIGGVGTNVLSYQDHDQAHPIDVTLPAPGSTIKTKVPAGAPAEEDSLWDFTHLYGGAGSDTLTGNSQANTIVGAGGDDKLDGKVGNDNFYSEPGGDEVHGSSDSATNRGRDTMSYAPICPVPIPAAWACAPAHAPYVAATASVTVALDNAKNDGLVDENDNVFDDIEVLIGGAFDDTLTGSGLDDILIGQGGNDTLVGNGANDTLHGDDAVLPHDDYAALGDDGLPDVPLVGAVGGDKIYADGGDEENQDDFGLLLLPAGQTYGLDKLYGGGGADFLDAADKQSDLVLSCGVENPELQDVVYYDLSEFADDFEAPDQTCAGEKAQGVRVGWSKWKRVDGRSTPETTDDTPGLIVSSGAAATSNGDGIVDLFYQDDLAHYNEGTGQGTPPWRKSPIQCPELKHQRYDGTRWTMVETIPIPGPTYCTFLGGPSRLSATTLADGRIVLATHTQDLPQTTVREDKIWVKVQLPGGGWTDWQERPAAWNSTVRGVAVTRLGASNDFVVFEVAGWEFPFGKWNWLWSDPNINGQWTIGPWPSGLALSVSAAPIAPAAVPMGDNGAQVFFNGNLGGEIARMYRLGFTCTSATNCNVQMFPTSDMACPPVEQSAGEETVPQPTCPIGGDDGAAAYAYKYLTAVNTSPAWTTFIASSPDGLWERVGKPHPQTVPPPDQLWNSPWSKVWRLRSATDNVARTGASATSPAYATIRMFGAGGAQSGIAPLEQIDFDPRPASTQWVAQTVAGLPISKAPAAVQSAPGKLDVVFRDIGSSLFTRTYDVATRSWSAWGSISGAPGSGASDPVAVSSGQDGRVDVFQHASRSLYWRWRDRFGTWSAWVCLCSGTAPANQVTGTPSAVAWGSGRIDVTVRGIDDVVRRLSCASPCTGASHWSASQSLGGAGVVSDSRVSGAPAVTVGRQDVAVLRNDGNGYNVYHRWDEAIRPGWWSALGAPTGGIIGDPIAFSYRFSRADVFVRGADGSLHRRNTFDGLNWAPWTNLGAPGGGLQSDPVVVSRVPGLIEVFVVGADRALWQLSISSTYGLGLWERISQPGVTTTPAVIATAAGRVDVFAGASTGLLHLTFESDRYPTDPPPPEQVPSPGKPPQAASYHATIRYGDVNGDGNADVCGRSAMGVACALSNGTGFGPLRLWDSHFSDANGYGDIRRNASIQLVDLNHDNKDDVCMRAANGIWCSMSTGTAFEQPRQWDSFFTDAVNGWNEDPATIRYGDINGDGHVDVCGRELFFVQCAIGTGTSFTTPWLSERAYYSWLPGYLALMTVGFGSAGLGRTVALADVNGDGKDDWCGRWGDGVRCGLSQGTWFEFERLWTGGFRDGWWADSRYSKTLRFADLDGDGKADVCGRGPTPGGVECEYSNGTNFVGNAKVGPDFADANGYGNAASAESAGLADVNGDGALDFCARRPLGITCGIWNGSQFAGKTEWSLEFSDANGWGW
ncbi:MAG: hypothetical protein ACT4OX_11280 [Actinomycetota bacterium]